jgi:hypothetical protein
MRGELLSAYKISQTFPGTRRSVPPAAEQDKLRPPLRCPPCFDHSGPFRGLGGDPMWKIPPSSKPGPGSLSNDGGRPNTQAKVRIIRPVTSKPAMEPRKIVANSSPQPFSPIRSPATKVSPQTHAAHGKPHNGLHSLDRRDSLQVGHGKVLERKAALGTSPPQTGHFISRIPVSPGRRRRHATALSLTAR